MVISRKIPANIAFPADLAERISNGFQRDNCLSIELVLEAIGLSLGASAIGIGRSYPLSEEPSAGLQWVLLDRSENGVGSTPKAQCFGREDLSPAALLELDNMLTVPPDGDCPYRVEPFHTAKGGVVEIRPGFTSAWIPLCHTPDLGLRSVLVCSFSGTTTRALESKLNTILTHQNIGQLTTLITSTFQQTDHLEVDQLLLSQGVWQSSEDLASAIAGVIQTLFRSRVSVWIQIDTIPRLLECVVSRGIDGFPPMRFLEKRKTMLGSTMAKRKIQVFDLESNSELLLTRELVALGVRSVVMVPGVFRNSSRGCIAMNSPRAVELGKHQENVLKKIGNFLGLGLQSLKVADQTVSDSLDNQRKLLLHAFGVTIGKLHDDLNELVQIDSENKNKSPFRNLKTDIDHLEDVHGAFTFHATTPEARKLSKQSLSKLVERALRWPVRRGYVNTTYVSMSVNIDSDVQVRANDYSFRFALQNVVNNAAHAILNDKTEKLGEISLTSRIENNQVLLRVHNSGPSIPDIDRPNIWRFNWTSKQDQGGTGLGLPISRLFMKAMGGDLYLDRKVSTVQGETFTFVLPEA